MLCEYAFNEKHELVHVDSVPNGLDCNCTCPCCGEKMIARQGKINEHCFAHSSGAECEGYYETLIHIWAKEIIAEEKCIMLPEYKDTQYNGLSILNESTLEYNYIDFKLNKQVIKFETVEIEQRNDLSDLQPDIVGITEDGLRLWIEIAVTHKCDDNKIQKIKNNNINCIEIQIPENIYSKDELKEFLLNNDGIIQNKYYETIELKKFINYPYGDSTIEKHKEEKYLQLKEKYFDTSFGNCKDCFLNVKLQKCYENLLEENKELSAYKEFGYIYRYEKFVDLINKYPETFLKLYYAICKQIETKYNLGNVNLSELLECYNIDDNLYDMDYNSYKILYKLKKEIDNLDKQKIKFSAELLKLTKKYKSIIQYNYDVNCKNLVAYDNKDLRLCSLNISTDLFE